MTQLCTHIGGLSTVVTSWWHYGECKNTKENAPSSKTQTSTAKEQRVWGTGKEAWLKCLVSHAPDHRYCSHWDAKKDLCEAYDGVPWDLNRYNRSVLDQKLLFVLIRLCESSLFSKMAQKSNCKMIKHFCIKARGERTPSTVHRESRGTNIRNPSHAKGIDVSRTPFCSFHLNARGIGR